MGNFYWVHKCILVIFNIAVVLTHFRRFTAKSYGFKETTIYIVSYKQLGKVQNTYEHKKRKWLDSSTVGVVRKWVLLVMEL